MLKFKGLILAALFLLSACQSAKISVTILDGKQTYSLETAERVPSKILSLAKLTLGVNDRLFYLGSPIPLDTALPEARSCTLTVRRALSLTIVAPDGTKSLQTSAATVGQALTEAGFTLYAADRLDPPASTPIEGALTVTYEPSREFTIKVDGIQVQMRSAAATVGEALAETGLPLVGLDYSLPAENEALPADGQIKVVRVVESVALTQESIPYKTRTELSADLELDQQALLQGGEPGLAIARLRSRSEDGQPTSQTTEAASIVHPPQDRILGIGTKVVIHTATVDGVEINYWRAVTLYATYYIPCIPGTNDCHYGTASGTRVRKGAAALVYPWYLLLAGERLYVPGYGFATVEDNNGALTSAYWGTAWIDLGYAQTDSVDWINHYVTVYFLAPIPANIADLYVMP